MATVVTFDPKELESKVKAMYRTSRKARMANSTSRWAEPWPSALATRQPISTASRKR